MDQKNNLIDLKSWGKRDPDSMCVYIVRGLPGSGKSSLARNIVGTRIGDDSSRNLGFYNLHLEADMFFLNDKGDYVYDRDKIVHAHQKCLDSFEHALWKVKTEPEFLNCKIVVSNTFTREAEFYSYKVLAERLGFKVFVITVEGRHESVHDVPEDVMINMHRRYEHPDMEGLYCDVDMMLDRNKMLTVRQCPSCGNMSRFSGDECPACYVPEHISGGSCEEEPPEHYDY